jgi:hypothetical protein
MSAPSSVLRCLDSFAVSPLCEVFCLPCRVVEHHSSRGERTIKQDWHPDELIQHWTLSDEECLLLGHKTGATRLAFAVLLKAFQYEGRFPMRGDTVPVPVVVHLAEQVDVPMEAYATVD